MDAVDLYRQTRSSLTARGRALSDDEALHPVPACPGWRVRDVYAHLAGVAADILDQHMDGGGTPQWTAAQIAARQDRTLGEIIQEWDDRAPNLEALICDARAELAPALLGDIVTHRCDIHGALGERPADGRGIAAALDAYVPGLSARVADAQLPALELGAGNQNWLLGKGEPTASVTAPEFELLRSLTGRRSPRQVNSFAWTHDPTPYLRVWSAYGPLRDTDLSEAS